MLSKILQGYGLLKVPGQSKPSQSITLEGTLLEDHGTTPYSGLPLLPHCYSEVEPFAFHWWPHTAHANTAAKTYFCVIGIPLQVVGPFQLEPVGSPPCLMSYFTCCIYVYFHCWDPLVLATHHSLPIPASQECMQPHWI